MTNNNSERATCIAISPSLNPQSPSAAFDDARAELQPRAGAPDGLKSWRDAK